ncbi:DgyrCDS14855 [Dimorphilus gyrociliatus]|uniref:DgyrCDS14855 n=1 Tax=Dimorphilus gyrociliatus TaxID=2664684 RepID=A0A7I8WF49_9ANNE|nr:DgyrCDS14855 [Dimorphilus gyrociliatus]
MILIQWAFSTDATCTASGKTFHSEMPVYFSGSAPSPWASATGDPHSAQKVVDKSTMSTKQICYDVTGQMGDYIYIAGYSDSGIKTNQLKFEIVNGQKIIFTELKSSIAIAVEKSNHFLGEMHLDVNFRLMPKDYNEMNGLIGDIGKKQFTFFSPVQIGDDSLNNEIASVQVDNNFLKGSVVQRNKNSCWLLDVNDILKPLKLTDYLFKRID